MRSRNIWFVLPAALVLVGTLSPRAAAPQTASATVTINAAQTFQTMRGWGASLSFTRDMNFVSQATIDQMIDESVDDLGLTFLRIGYGLLAEPFNDNANAGSINWAGFHDTGSVDRDVARGMGRFAQRVQARGESPVFLLDKDWEFSAPAWMTDAEFGEHITANLLYYKNQHGININFNSIDNEPGYYDPYTPARQQAMIKVLGPMFQANGLGTKIALNEGLDASSTWTYITAMQNDAAVWPHVGLLNWHLYGANDPYRSQIRDFGIARGIPTAMTACVTETIAGAVKTGADFSLSHRAVWPDGSARWLSGSGRVLLDEHGQAVRGVGISMDVTDRRVLEDQFRQSQKMDAIGGLAGGVAHDFNNLLTVILGHCELIASDLAPSDPRLVDVAAIQHAGATATALTRQLLAFSRKQIIEPTRLDLNVVVGEMRGMLARLIREDVNIVVALGSDLAAITADRAQVEQIILNLAVNARDAMPGGGTLTMTTTALRSTGPDPTTPTALTPGRYVVLTVTDTGVGMTPAVHARIFEPFFTTKEVGSGTGLGLATVHGIVMQSGGAIDVRTEVGRGTSFTIYFPESDARLADLAQPAMTPRTSTGGETVLVVEDAGELRELTKRLLVRQGYTVLLAANAREALHQFEQHPSINLLLTDVVMPITSGPELSHRLMAQRSDLSVIYMSGHAADDIAQHGVLKPGIAFLQKPFSSETLGHKIREVLDG